MRLVSGVRSSGIIDAVDCLAGVAYGSFMPIPMPPNDERLLVAPIIFAAPITLRRGGMPLPRCSVLGVAVAVVDGRSDDRFDVEGGVLSATVVVGLPNAASIAEVAGESACSPPGEAFTAELGVAVVVVVALSLAGGGGEGVLAAAVVVGGGALAAAAVVAAAVAVAVFVDGGGDGDVRVAAASVVAVVEGEGCATGGDDDDGDEVVVVVVAAAAAAVGGVGFAVADFGGVVRPSAEDTRDASSAARLAGDAGSDSFSGISAGLLALSRLDDAASAARRGDLLLALDDVLACGVVAVPPAAGLAGDGLAGDMDAAAPRYAQ